jgi:hypothetical protein
MSGYAQTMLTLTPIQADRSEDRLADILDALAESCEFEPADEPALVATVEAAVPVPAGGGPIPGPEEWSRWLRVVGDARFPAHRFGVALYLYPAGPDSGKAGITVRFGESAYKAIFGYRPSVEGAFDPAAKEALLSTCLVIAGSARARGFALTFDSGVLEPLSGPRLRKRLIKPTRRSMSKHPFLLAGAKESVATRAEFESVWGLEFLLDTTNGYTLVDMLRPPPP